jgi:uncharacterized protein involved in exopolysaccharide biosynthesis
VEKKRTASEESLAPGEPSMWDAYSVFKEVITVNNDSKTGLVTVKADWKDPNLAAQWVNELVKRLNYELRQQAIHESERSIQFLNEQIQETSLADLRTVLYRLVEEHTKNMTLAKVNEQYALKVIDPAVPPQERAKPKRTLIVVFGFAMGLLSGIIIAFVWNYIQVQRTQKTDQASSENT